MNEIWSNVGRLSVYSLSFFLVLAYFWYAFVIYKKGLEFRYRGETLFDFCILSAGLGWIGARSGYVVAQLAIFRQNWLRVILISEYPGYNYVGLLLGLILAVAVLARREELKFYEGLDLVGLGLPAAMAFERLGRVFAGDVHLIWRLPFELLQALTYLTIFVWLWCLEKEYRTLAWYRYRRTQARPGFIFGSFLVLSGLAAAVSGIWPVFSSSLAVSGLAAALAGVVLIYRRSGRILEHDLKLIPFISRWYTRSK